MFEPLFARLSDRYHLVAPDYPGFGHSDWPDPKQFAYTFDHYAEIMNHFTEALGLSRYTLYMQDYGGPVGFRMALAHPDRIEALIVQDAVAHNEGLGANWKTRRAFWADRTDTDPDTALAPLQAAACTYRTALGPRAGQKVLSLKTVPSQQRLHLIRFNSVLAPNAKRRPAIIPSGSESANHILPDHGDKPPPSAPACISWARPSSPSNIPP